MAFKAQPSRHDASKRRSDSMDATAGGAALSFAYALPPWPEWSDAELTTERWDSTVTTGTPKGRDKMRHGSATVSMPIGYEDPLGHAALPPSLEVLTWSRLHSFPDMVVCAEENDVTLDLSTPNTHLLHSEVMRWVIAGIMNLYQLARTRSVELEGEGHLFNIPASKPWRPWHHVYSLSKAMKGMAYKPLVNPFGKYIVRLFYMGAWRRLTVDDYLPKDSLGRPLLPMTQSGRELWMPLLAKALLRVASLSWRPGAEILDFSVVACLTGWHSQELDLMGVPCLTAWWLCQKLLMTDSEDPESRFTGVECDLKVNMAAYTHPSAKQDTPVSSEYGSNLTDPDTERLGTVVLCGVVQELSTDTIPDFGPCPEHPILITEAKIVNRGDINKQPPIQLWKLFRWKKWAIEQGIIEDDTLKYINSIRVYSSLQNRPPPSEDEISASETDILAAPSLPTPVLQPVPSQKSRTVHNKGDKRALNKISEVEMESRTMSQMKDMNKARRSVIKTKEIEIKKEEDFKMLETWIDFSNLSPCLTKLQVYYRSSSFVHNMKVTDISQLMMHPERIIPPKKTPNKDQTMPSSASSMIRATSLLLPPPPQTVKKTGTDVLYLLIDSLACKKLLISFSVLTPGVATPNVPVSLRLPVPPYNDMPNSVSTTISPTKIDQIPQAVNISDPHKASYHILGELYNWQAQSLGKIAFGIKTVGTKCYLLQIREGLIVFRLWIKAPEVYALRISSQTPFVLGSREKIQEILTGESISWTHYGSLVSSTYTALSLVEFRTPKHIEALTAFRKAYLPRYIPKPTSKWSGKLRMFIRSRCEEALMSMLFDREDNLEMIVKVISEWRWMFLNETFGLGFLFSVNRGEEIKELMGWDELNQPPVNINPVNTTSPRGTTRLSGSKSDSGQLIELDATLDGPWLDDISVSPVTGRTNCVKLDHKSAQELMRGIVGHGSDLIKYYPFRKDDKYRMAFTDYRGIVRVTTQDWLPLVRFVVNIHELKPSFCAVYLLTTIPAAVIRVINNDTLEEFNKFMDDVEPFHFTTNALGYTILAYGTLDGVKLKEISWRIRLASVDKEQIPHWCSWHTTGECIPQQPEPLIVKVMRGHYMPHKDNIIFKCLFTVQKSQILTLRAEMSNRNVEFLLRIRNEDDEVVKDYFGIGNILIPVLLLPAIDSGGPSFYLIEAELLRSSWTLTEQEKSVVNTLREKVRNDLLLFGDEGPPELPSKPAPVSLNLGRRSRKRTPVSVHRPSGIPENVLITPYWSLFLVVDQDKNADVTLDLDNRGEERIRNTKSQWEEAEPGRYHRAYQLRKKFCETQQYSQPLGSSTDESLKPTDLKLADILSEFQVKQSDDIKMLDDTLKAKQQADINERLRQFNETFSDIMHEWNNLKEKQNSCIDTLKKHEERLRGTSADMLEAAYAGRELCIAQELELNVDATRISTVQIRSRSFLNDKKRKSKSKI